MKTCVSIVFLLSVQFVIAQTKATNFGSIDKHVANIDASSPKELEQELTTPYQTDLEKIRAFFSWIAQHISYDCASYKLRTKNSKSSVTGAVNYDVDTSSELTPLNQLVAEDVMRKRMAFCYGYARLFKCLCDYASIPCEIINGYARGDLNKVGNNFRTNHSWNAVKLDSNWYLVDVTWASGYFTYNSNEFIKHFDDQYFLTPPEQFALDHFPDDLVWSLLQQPPAIKEFQHSPYKGRCFTKYNITSYGPETGVIQAAVGDTIRLFVQTNLVPGRNIGGGSIYDTSVWSPLPAAIYCKPETINKNIIDYSYVVQSADTQWLQLVYNDDMILRYKLDIKGKKEQHNSAFRN